MDICTGASGENFKHGMSAMDEQKSIPKTRAGIYSNGGEHRKNGNGKHSPQTEPLGNESTGKKSTDTWHKEYRWKVQRLVVIVVVTSIIVAVMAFLFSEFISALRYSYFSESEIRQVQFENERIRKKQEEVERRLSVLEIQQKELLSTFYAVRDSVDSVHLFIEEFRQESEIIQKASSFISPEKRESKNE